MNPFYYCIIALVLSVFMITLATDLIKSKKQESFVAWNNEQVRQESPYGLLKDDERVIRLFNQIVQQDANKFGTKQYTNFKETTTFEEEIKGIIHYVLRTINEMGNRRFTALDTISTKKEQTLDPEDRMIVNRWTVNLFIQEKNKLNVHAWSMLISFTLIQKGDIIKIEKLHTITDHFYKKPLVDGMNPYDKFYYIKNPLHLMKPWRTSGDPNGHDVLPDDGNIEQQLETWHKDLKTPQYRCFSDADITIDPKQRTNGFYQEQGDRYKNRIACQESGGTWDKPVDADNECPFYRGNKNYPNRLGGVKLHDSRCEMPVNVKTIGYRYASSDPKHKPLCYNCINGLYGPGSVGYCCSDQLDPELYKGLSSPDYYFPGDELERYQQRDVLAQRGLNWQKIPTHIRNIEDKNQRQPVFNAIVGQGPGKINLP